MSIRGPSGVFASWWLSLFGNPRKAVGVSGWPLCARRRTRQIITLGVRLAVIAVGVAAFVPSGPAGDSTTNNTSWPWWLLGGLAVAFAGLFAAWHARALGASSCRTYHADADPSHQPRIVSASAGDP
jgi:hypothetical protein